MWEWDYKESWVPKNLCFWAVVLEKTLESPLNCKEIKPVNPKGNQPWIFIGRTDGEAETPILWPPDAKNRLIWKHLMLGKTEAGGDGDDRGWDGWMASLTQWTWVWASSEHRWWTGKPGMLQTMGSQRVGDDLVTELTWTEGCENDYKSSGEALGVNFSNNYFLFWTCFSKASLHSEFCPLIGLLVSSCIPFAQHP